MADTNIKTERLNSFLLKNSYIKETFRCKLYYGEIPRDFTITYNLYFLYYWCDETIRRIEYYQKRIKHKKYTMKRSENYYIICVEEFSEGVKHIENLIDKELRNPTLTKTSKR